MPEPQRLRMNILVDEVETPELYARLAAIHNDKLRARTLRQLAHERLVLFDEKPKLTVAPVSLESTPPINKGIQEATPQATAQRQSTSGIQPKSIPKLPKGFQPISLG